MPEQLTQVNAWLRLAMPDATPGWREVVGAVLIVLMLVCFYSVVNGATRQAELHRRTNAAQADAESYCRAMPDRRDRDSCMVRVGVEPEDGDKP